MIQRGTKQNQFDAASDDRCMRECHHSQLKKKELTMIVGSTEVGDGLQVSRERLLNKKHQFQTKAVVE